MLYEPRHIEQDRISPYDVMKKVPSTLTLRLLHISSQQRIPEQGGKTRPIASYVNVTRCSVRVVISNVTLRADARTKSSELRLLMSDLKQSRTIDGIRRQ